MVNSRTLTNDDIVPFEDGSDLVSLLIVNQLPLFATSWEPDFVFRHSPAKFGREFLKLIQLNNVLDLRVFCCY